MIKVDAMMALDAAAGQLGGQSYYSQHRRALNMPLYEVMEPLYVLALI